MWKKSYSSTKQSDWWYVFHWIVLLIVENFQKYLSMSHFLCIFLWATFCVSFHEQFPVYLSMSNLLCFTRPWKLFHVVSLTHTTPSGSVQSIAVYTNGNWFHLQFQQHRNILRLSCYCAVITVDRFCAQKCVFFISHHLSFCHKTSLMLLCCSDCSSHGRYPSGNNNCGSN